MKSLLLGNVPLKVKYCDLHLLSNGAEASHAMDGWVAVFERTQVLVKVRYGTA